MCGTSFVDASATRRCYKEGLGVFHQRSIPQCTQMLHSSCIIPSCVISSIVAVQLLILCGA
ncbi:uncharacterized protein LAESUDRAFT_727358 [Laetiporus sulphureus 93-53]|uniref:Uncharacterized protein n=1 Tax=Laetiporus sulphureus 93-53 TaxID=1314785 RepID=A0A165DKS6_9APHY|nr:uncharacterized protein LAESUDRAFT_727358 [Laetiporus sulphureus 93-53]KZT05101.1 hypothetical protein LAESUDRAFT_727358 [Laetiporus sulphureus 93-53]